MKEQAQATTEEHVLVQQAQAIKRLRRAVAKKITYAKADEHHLAMLAAARAIDLVPLAFSGHSHVSPAKRRPPIG